MIGALYDAARLTILKLLVLLEAVKRKARPIHGRIIAEGPGGQAPGSRNALCLFAHFDRDGVVDDYVVSYLQALDELGCETVFVSTAEGFGEREIAKILPFCRQFIIRQNTGYDFASWRTGLEAVGDISGYERLIVANDSVYGPFQDLRGIFAEMNGRRLSFWGITDSLRYGRHLQSYFMVFERPVLENSVFTKFWWELPDYRNKHVLIIQGEVGLTRRLSAAGFGFAAYNPVEQVCENMQTARGGMLRKIIGCRFNTTNIGWHALLRVGCPFLKVQLLRDNPRKLEGLALWEQVVKDVSDYDTKLILRHLKRVGSSL